MKNSIYKSAKDLGLDKKDVDIVLSSSRNSNCNSAGVDLYKAGTDYGTVSPKELYKAGTEYGTVSPKEIYKADTKYGTISPEDL